MKRKSSTFVAFVLFTLMFFKVSSFHVYSHQDTTLDEIENCKICEVAVENQDSEYLFTAAQTVSFSHIEFNIVQPQTIYDTVVFSSFLRSNFFGRPPPNMA